MRKNWIAIVGCLVLVTGPVIVQAQEAAQSVEAKSTLAASSDGQAAKTQRGPKVSGSAGLGFRKVSPSGEFADAEQTVVRIVSRGRIVQTQRVGEGGVAQIADVANGTYSVLASGNEGIAAYGIYLGGNGQVASSRVGLVPAQDAQLVQDLIRSHRQGGPVDAAVPTEAETAGSSTGIEDFEIAADGSVKGHASRPRLASQSRVPISNLYVAFVQGGRVVAQTHTDATGNFTVTGLTAGIYSLAVSGQGGFAAYSTKVTQSESLAQARTHRLQFVALQAGGGGSALSPASADDFGLFNNTLGTSSGVQTAMSGGGGFSGLGGAGGGGQGSGGSGSGGSSGGRSMLGSALAGGGMGGLLGSSSGSGKSGRSGGGGGWGGGGGCCCCCCAPATPHCP